MNLFFRSVTARDVAWCRIITIVVFVSVSGVVSAEESRPAGLHCIVMPSAVVDVSSGTDGRVEGIYVERGDAVREGQIVAELDSGVERANLALAQVRAELDTEIHLRRTRLAFDERKRKRSEALRVRQVVSAFDQDEADTDAELAAWQLHQARDKKRLAKMEHARAKEVVLRRMVRTPIEGVVVERFKSAGEYVAEEPILRVARLDPLWVEVVAPVALHGGIHKGMDAEVFVETEADIPREARVLVVDPMGDAASGTFRVRLQLPNPGLKLLGGIKCQAWFPSLKDPLPEQPGETDGSATRKEARQQRGVSSPPPWSGGYDEERG